MIKVSVAIITYNHESYINQAIESILNQRTDFEIEIVIGEDSSTDKTRKICLEYQKKHPDQIKLQASQRTLGMMQNFIRTLNACTGKYIALCEGDDYWTDPFKLQKQVEFMEGNEEYGMTFHAASIIENGQLRYFHKHLKYLQIENSRQIEGFEILLDWIIPTASVVFRNFNTKLTFMTNPNILYGDIFLFLYLAEKTKIYYIHENMSVYRMLGNGARLVDFNKIVNYVTINHYRYIRSTFTDSSVKWVASYYICENLLYIINHYYKKLLLLKAVYHLKEFLKEYYQIKKNYPKTLIKPLEDIKQKWKLRKKEMLLYPFSLKFYRTIKHKLIAI